MNLLKTVCAAGRARPAFNDCANERLEQLENAGLIDLVYAPSADPKRPTLRAYYRPTEMGREMCQRIASKGAA